MLPQLLRMNVNVAARKFKAKVETRRATCAGRWRCSRSTTTERRPARCRTADQIQTSRSTGRQLTAAATSVPRAGSGHRRRPTRGVRTSARRRTAAPRSRRSSTTRPLTSSLRRTRRRTGRKPVRAARPRAERRRSDRTSLRPSRPPAAGEVRSSTASVCRRGTPWSRAATERAAAAATTTTRESCGRRRPAASRR